MDPKPDYKLAEHIFKLLPQYVSTLLQNMENYLWLWSM